MRAKRKSILMLAVFMLAMVSVSFTHAETAEAKTKKMTTYSDILKIGNTVICGIGEYVNDEIVSVDLSTGQVKKLAVTPGGGDRMAVKNGYLYYIYAREGIFRDALYRVNLSTGKKQKLATGVVRYVINGKKIYYRVGYLKKNYKPAYKNKVMKLNGKSKKKSSVKTKVIEKTSNDSNYKVIKQETGQYIYNYLQLPDGSKIYLGRFEEEDFDI